MQAEVNIFLDSLNSEHTKEQYQIHWERYQKSKPIEDTQSTKVIEGNIIRYLVEMKVQGLSHSYRNSAFSAIKHYYTMNDVVLNWHKISKLLGEKAVQNEIRGYTREEITKLLAIADTKYRAIILTLCSTGMRREALAQIKKTDLEYLEDHKLYKITIYKKSKHEMVCFTTPEAAEAINLHLQMNKDDRAELFYFKTPKNLTMTLRQIQIRSGVGSEHIANGEIVGQARNNIPAVHGLKKFCVTQMAKSKVDTEKAKILTDHSIGVRSSYVEYSDDDLLEEYLKAVNNLTINEENRLKSTVKILQEKNAEIESLRDQMNAMKEQFDEVLHIKKNLVKGELLNTVNRGGKELEFYATNEKDCKIIKEKQGGAEHLLKLGPTNVLGEVVSEEDINKMIKGAKKD